MVTVTARQLQRPPARHRQDRLQYTVPLSLARSVIKWIETMKRFIQSLNNRPNCQQYHWLNFHLERFGFDDKLSIDSGLQVRSIVPCTNSFVMTVAVIEVNNLSADVTSASFIGTMESRLASVYSLAMSSMSSVQPSYGRHRRAATFHNATIQVTNVQFSHHSFIHWFR